MTGLRVTLRHLAHKPAYLSPRGGELFAAVQKQGEQSAEIRVYQAH